MVERQERRRHRRVSLHIPVICAVGAERRPVSGSLIDLGEGGAAVILASYARLGSEALLTFRVGDVTCQARGKVVRLIPNPEGQGVGLELFERDGHFLNFARNLTGASEFERAGFLEDLREVTLEIA